MSKKPLIWSVLGSEMLPLAETVYRDLASRHKTAGTEAGAPEPHPHADDLDRLKGELQAAKSGGPPSSAVAGLALAYKFDEVFRRARGRAGWYFWIHLVMAIIMIVLFLGGAAGATLSAVLNKANIWGIVFGGVSLTGIFGLLVVRPLRMVLEALTTSMRLDLMQLQYGQEMQHCANLPLYPMTQCFENLWIKMKEDIKSLL